ncbi:MAG: hypothetical protein NTZ20_05135 [Candidatus Levybacteria bacterium]|nr:hypothetical protein [Candidatus Levybacteria bacterium]
MAFQIRNLSVLAYANGFTHWHYREQADSVREMNKSSYFTDAHDMMVVGDMLTVSCPEGVFQRAVIWRAEDCVILAPLLA